MLQLQHLKLLRELTGLEAHEMKAVKFGYEQTYTIVQNYLIGSQKIPANMVLVVLRSQAYLVNQLETAADYGYYRTHPSGVAFWRLATIAGVTTTALRDWTSRLLPAQLALDSDEFLFFPPGYYAQLVFVPTDAAPATGQWMLRGTIYGYFVPSAVSDKLLESQQWLNSQD
jgi:hypothetical protein